MSTEFHAALDLLQMLIWDSRTGVLMLLLVIAATSDVRSGRIPNWLVFGGATYALLHNVFFPVFPMQSGLLFALGGLALGLGMLLPAYIFRFMGAGDVKLMAMVGAFLGASATLGVVLATLIVGGALALLIVLYQRTLVRMLSNISMICKGTMLSFVTGVQGLSVQGGASAGKMPYGLAIAIGTIGYLVLSQLGLI